MLNKINIRNSIIVILCLTIIVLCIGFSFLSVELKKEKETDFAFQVNFENVEKSSSVKGSSKEPFGKAEIINQKMGLNFDFSLSSSHDEITYLTTIKNNSDISCEIVDVVLSPDYINSDFKKQIAPVEVTATDLRGKVIPPKEEVEYKVTAYYMPSTLPLSTKSFSFQANILAKSR